MKQMKKLISILLVAALMLSFTGCSVIGDQLDHVGDHLFGGQENESPGQLPESSSSQKDDVSSATDTPTSSTPIGTTSRPVDSTSSDTGPDGSAHTPTSSTPTGTTSRPVDSTSSGTGSDGSAHTPTSSTPAGTTSRPVDSTSSGTGSDDSAHTPTSSTPTGTTSRPAGNTSSGASSAASHVHSYSTVTITAATCTTAGKTAEVCSCGDSKTTVVPALGHQWGDWTVVKEPTDLSGGLRGRTCTRCSSAEYESIDPLPHTHNYIVTESVEATCTSAGKKVETCDCGAKQTTTISALGHQWGAWVTVTAATTTSTGTKRRTCSRCGITENQTIPMLHTHSYTVTSNTAPTCTTAGKKVETCACGASKITNYTALGHQWGAWNVLKEPTVSATGTKQRTCSRCGITQNETIAKLPMTITQAQQEILRLVNAERAKEGLNPLLYYTAGQKAADIRAQEIMESFSHTRPNGTSCFTALDEQGVQYYSAGENIAKGYPMPEDVMEAWMNSEGHRKNIMNPNFTHIIVGVNGTVGQYRVGWVQLFVTPAD